MSPGSSTESYPAFAYIGLRKNPGKTSTSVDISNDYVDNFSDDDEASFNDDYDVNFGNCDFSVSYMTILMTMTTILFKMTIFNDNDNDFV
ncbi:hypothetical protein ANN_05166 [Periplaneta americana]|uniref:Uncharacterized protein n=1 Tax=Periplaneta americana TaxID=6978 RepID=A0ABQ8TC30_PERAM|nr:hypothetical protein ANN_05166 [Periplaneta americana]